MFQPQRLQVARHRRGLNKTKLAAAAETTAQSISDYERGDTEPPRAVVERLAKALSFPVEFFHSEIGDVVPQDAASFRALSRMTAAQRDAALAAGTMCVALSDWIEDRFDLPVVDIPDFPPGTIDPEGAAASVRGQWGLGLLPISNVLHLLESKGVRVFALAHECREVDAFSFWRNQRPFVCLGTHKTPERAIFDLAHELGHLLLHRDHAAPRGRPEEREADAFASSFLMPKADVEAVAPRFPSYHDLVRAKGRWKVSVAALNFRLHKLGLITDWHYRELCIEISRLGRDHEPESVQREQSLMLTKVLTALREEGITQSQVAADLHIYQDDLRSLVAGLTVTTLAGGREPVESVRPILRVV